MGSLKVPMGPSEAPRERLRHEEHGKGLAGLMIRTFRKVNAIAKVSIAGLSLAVHLTGCPAAGHRRRN